MDPTPRAPDVPDGDAEPLKVVDGAEEDLDD